MTELLNNFGKLVALAAFIVLALAVTREWAYFSVVGSQFQPLVSSYDYLVSALFWLPTTILIFVILGTIDYKAGPGTPLERTLRSWLVHSLGILFVLSSTISFLFGHIRWVTADVYSLAFIYLWAQFSNRFFPKLIDKIHPIVLLCAVFTPMLLVGAYSRGVASAYRDLNANNFPYLLTLKNGAESMKVVLLRDLDKGVLIRLPDSKKIDFYRWENINVLSHEVITPTEPHVCEFFGILACTRFG